MVLSMGHRADLLLDMAGLDYNQKLMLQSSVQNVRDFEPIAEALLQQHPNIHKREGRASTSHDKGSSASHRGARQYKKPYSANLAEWYQESDVYDEYEDDIYQTPNDAYQAQDDDHGEDDWELIMPDDEMEASQMNAIDDITTEFEDPM